MFKFTKEKCKSFISGMSVMLVLALSVNFVFAQIASKSISVEYKNIKLFVDDTEFIPKDANGKIVEPFIYNGTTYLPVRGIANAMGKAVLWDGKNSQVFLGKHESTESKGYLDYDIKSFFNTHPSYISQWSGNDNLGNSYSKGISLEANSGFYPNKSDYVEYILNRNYTKFIAKCFLSETDKNTHKSSTINFYGDDKLIYTTSPITGGVLPQDIEVNLTGVFKLRIEVLSNDIDASSFSAEVVLGDPKVY